MTTFFDQLAKLSPERRALLEKKLAQQGLNTTLPDRIDKRPANTPAPLSFAQQRLWFVQQLEPNASTYNVASVLRFSGPLNVERMTNALHQLVQRHEILRTRFVRGEQADQTRQVVEPTPEACELLPFVDFSLKSSTEENKSAVQHNVQKNSQQTIQKIISAPFDLSQLPLRCALIKESGQEHLLVLATHHIVSDRWSVGVFLRELATLYQSGVSQLAPLPIQYGDYALWQRERLQGEALQQVQQYWQTRLAGDLPLLELPHDRPRPKQITDSGAHYPLQLSATLSTRLREKAQSHQVTLFQLLLAAFKILLYRYSQCDDILVGTDIANRDRPETESLIGLLVNTLVLRTRIQGDATFDQVLQDVKQGVVDAMAHQDLPFEQVVELVKPQRHLDQLMPLFQAKFDLQLARVQAIKLDGLTLSRETPEESRTKYELRFNLQDTESGIGGQIEYSTDLFDRDTIEAMAGHFDILLNSILDLPDTPVHSLPILSQQQRQQALFGWNTPAPANADVRFQENETLISLFQQQVDRTPDAIAVNDGKQTLSYRELNQQADSIALSLQQRGIQRENPVGILLSRKAGLLAALLGVMKSGACYVPLDPDYPDQRLQMIAEDASLAAILVEDQEDRPLPLTCPRLTLADLLLQDAPVQGIESQANQEQIQPDQLAYIIYTSGSTGRPKGVAIEHRSTSAMLQWALDCFQREDLEQILAATSICFDLSVFELFLPLTCGGQVRLVNNAMALAELPQDCGVTLINTVPSVLNRVMNLGPLPNSVRVVNLAGEALPSALIKRIHHAGINRVYNLYGPSEDTTYSTWACFEPGMKFPSSRVPIGLPIHHTQAYVLDEQRQPVPTGVTGELYLGGLGLARGYYRQPELTRDRFIDNPFVSEGAPSLRLYKTGDRVRQRADGQIEFLGRNDDQVKIRGYRIEIGEVDQVLRQFPGVQEVVVSTPRINEEPVLVAWLESKEDFSLVESELKSFLQQRLPGWMVPTRFRVVETLPRLPNGKINRNALPSFETGQTQAGTEFHPAQTALEKTLVSIWCEILKRDQIGLDDDFFVLGGHSLMAMDLIARCQQQLSRNIPLRTLFQTPTVSGMVTYLQQSADEPEADHRAVIELDPRPEQANEPFPLTDIQQAYLVGRNAAFELGNVSTHGYREIEVSQISVAEVEAALNQLILRHGMLRMIIEGNQQRILPTVPHYRIEQTDLIALDNDERQTQLHAIRDRLSHQLFEPGQWPLFTVNASRVAEDRIRFHLGFDVLMGDAWSFQLLGRELAMLLLGHTLPPLDIAFRDYVVAEKVFEQSEPFQHSLAYWQNKVDELPAAPELPLTKSPGEVTQPRFVRRQGSLNATQWAALKRRAQQSGLTPSSLVLSVFTETLAAFSRVSDFTLNLTLFNRQPVHPQVNLLVGDFTSSLLLQVHHQNHLGFVENARAVQQQLWQDLEHRAVSGVRVQRELARARQRAGGALMPVVFTSTLNQNLQSTGPDHWQAEFVNGVSQTSQVYLDHQVSEVNGELHFNWDSIDELFPEGFLDYLCDSHQQRLQQLAENAEEWNRSWHPQRFAHWLADFRLADFNNTGKALTQGQSLRLHDLFFNAASQYPNNIAVIASRRSLTYAELAAEVIFLARRLQAFEVQPNELVAVAMEKGWQQVVATLAVMASGAAYVPIDPALPTALRFELAQDTRTRLILRGANDTSEWPENLPQWVIEADSQDCISGIEPSHSVDSNARESDLAYVIYTSGSTGKPKGVMIDHRGAVNTVLDVNLRHRIQPEDRVFGLSSLSFDLSVYDLFGTLASGAALVLPDPQHLQDPSHWLQGVQQHQVSVWNSVPALMQLLVDAIPAQQTLPNLRTVMMSGDWIPLTLPDAIRTRCPNAKITSMGGATEASIWSIEYPVETVEPDWHSIPYGRPLANQQWYVLDDQMRPRPPWVPGALYIGGIGLARGYWNRPQLTAQQFVPDPFGSSDKAGKANTLYRTGDLGCFKPDGTIEFLGREDHQVKLNGYRIELGEIEAQLQQHPSVQSAAVAINGNPPTLNGYFVPNLQNKMLQSEAKAQAWRESQDNETGIELPPVELPTDLMQRQSHRQFLQRAISLQQLAHWLSALRAWPVQDSTLNKHQYPSAGNRYPLRAYLNIKENAVTGLNSGWYYYHPQQHRMIVVDEHACDAWPGQQATLHYGHNQSLNDESGFSLYLVADMSLIEPEYGDGARDLALVESGYASQLLMQQAPHHDLGLCPVGGTVLKQVQAAVFKDSSLQVLHALFGGPIDPAWNQSWQTLQQSRNDAGLDALQDWLKQRLPAYMVPTRLQPIAALPLTANGKLNRSALPQPDQQSIHYRQPQSATEKVICDLWQELIQREQIGLDDDFFAVGGNSLIAMQMLSRLQQHFDPSLTLGQLYSALTPAAQARLMDSLAGNKAVSQTNRIEKLDRTAPNQDEQANATDLDIENLSSNEVDDLLAQLLAESGETS